MLWRLKMTIAFFSYQREAELWWNSGVMVMLITFFLKNFRSEDFNWRQPDRFQWLRFCGRYEYIAQCFRGDMAHCVTELSQLNAYLPLEKFPIYGDFEGKFFSSLPGAFNSVHTTPYHIFADVISFFCWVLFCLSILPILLIGLIFICLIVYL